MKRLYLSACLQAGKYIQLSLVLLVFGSILTQNRLRADQIFERSLSLIGREHVPGEFIVKFKPNATQAAISVLNSSHGVSIIYTSTLAGFNRLKIPSGRTVAEMVEIYEADENVEYAEANYIAYALMTPNDALYPYQWHLYNADYGGIQMESAWDTSTGSGVIVAVLDTGIAYETHWQEDSQGWISYYEQAPDLANTNFVAGYDFVNADEHPNDDSDSGHGTHIAGIIAQSTNNDFGTVGVAFSAALMPVKVLDKTGAGTYADIAEGIIWATDNGAHVINLGLGGKNLSKALGHAVAYAHNKTVTVIAAAGNDAEGTICYPAAYDDYVIAVGATRYDETLAYYSNYGQSLDLVAPGGDLNVDQNLDGYGDGVIQQTYEKSGFEKPAWGYCFMEGTSMAAAHVSATAALLIANATAVTPDEVRKALETTAEDKGPTSWDIEYGWGIIDAYAALQWKTGPGNGPGPLIPVAEFTTKQTIGPEPFTVQLTDQSGGNITDWFWNFGDGKTSNEQHPSHMYQEMRHYTVSLTVTGPDGSDNETKSNYINVVRPWRPVANFEGQPTTGDAPMTVLFTDLSTCQAEQVFHYDNGTTYSTIDAASHGGISDWKWDFGDGEISTERNPVHIYQKPGTYTVKLTVTGPAGSSYKRRYSYIHTTVPPVPVADFMAIPRSGDGPLTVQFIDQSTNVSSWLWDFGDGTTSTEQNPSHIYMHNNISDYTVTLIVEGPSGSDTITKTNYIHVNMPPINVNIDMSKSQVFRTWHTVTATITITKNDATGQPLGAATVQGAWGGAYGGTVSGTTDANGRISFGTEWIGGGSTVTLTINKIKIGGKEYDFLGEITDSIRI